ncbi:ABC transporter permease [Desulfolucanica intricata]|uniref:ABC transporter permease n=1 Tax=Desulfolucanica intricata TaxID=1285191 RepID=UPI00082DB125|nr:ABC transporter permease [Desulfolucanica intricata]
MHINYWQEVKRNNFGRAGLILLILLTGLAIMAPVLTQYEPATYTGSIFNPPSAEFWLGTNDVGQDIWTRILYGARTSLIVGCGVALLAAFLSMLVGGTAALIGGLYDRIVMRAVDAVIVIPPVIIVILIAAYLRPNLWLLVVLLSLLIWPGGARVIRAQTLFMKEKLHIKAARTFGAGWIYLLSKHIMPDIGPIIIAVMIQNARRAVFMEAGLSFLGISDPAMISWGRMMQHALKFSYLDVWKWWLLPTGIALSLTIISFVFIGFALENTLNPRLRKRVEH